MLEDQAKQHYLVGMTKLLNLAERLEIDNTKVIYADFDNYVGSRAQRGKFLPRGFRQVHAIIAV